LMGSADSARTGWSTTLRRRAPWTPCRLPFPRAVYCDGMRQRTKCFHFRMWTNPAGV